jgi:uncharacterized OB-fold protein
MSGSIQCTLCQAFFHRTPLELVLLAKMICGDSSFPPSSYCPVCRERSRLAFRNERNLHVRQCWS